MAPLLKAGGRRPLANHMATETAANASIVPDIAISDPVLTMPKSAPAAAPTTICSER